MSQALSIRLRAAGLEVITARDAYQAIQEERHHRPDVVVLDVRMPAGNGFKIHEGFKRFCDFCAPVIYITGQGDEEDERRAKALGAVAFLRKPVESTTLLDIIQQAIGSDACSSVD